MEACAGKECMGCMSTYLLFAFLFFFRRFSFIWEDFAASSSEEESVVASFLCQWYC